MTFYFRLLFISSFFLVSQQVAAQVELTTLTETTKPSAAKSAPLSPTVPVLDNSASIEQNFNATPITGEPNVSNPELERLIRQVSESQRRVEEYTKKAEEARVKADNDNKATQKEQEANKASQKAAEEEAKKQTELAAEQKKALESAQTAIKQKQDELNSVYQAELNKVKEQVGKNIPLFKAALASYDTSIDEIKQAQDKYWKTVPDVEDKTLLFESSQAQHEFAQQLAKLQNDQVTARASYERLTEQQVLLKNFKIDPAGPVKSEYNALLDNAQKASTDVSFP